MKTASVTTVLICLAIGVMIGKSVRDDAIASPPKQSVSNWDVGELIDEVQVDEDSVIEDFATKSELSALESRVASLEESVAKLKEKSLVPAAPSPPPVHAYSQVSNGSTGGSYGSVTSNAYSKTTVVQSTPVVSSSYVPRYTYPGTIQSHMAADHGVSTAGLSTSQLLAQHDAIHDVIGPTPAKVRSTSVVRQSVSNCPGGVCPVPSSAPQRSFRIFRR